MPVSLWIAVVLLVTGSTIALLFSARAQRRELVTERLGDGFSSLPIGTSPPFTQLAEYLGQ